METKRPSHDKHQHVRPTRIKPGGRGQIATTRIKPGKWQADCYYRDTDGKRRRAQRTGNSEAEATRNLIRSLSKGRAASVHTVEDLLRTWLEQHSGIAPTTRERYEDALRLYLLPAIGEVRVDDLSTPIVSDVIRDIFVEHSYFASQRSRSLVRMACKWGARMGVVERDFTAEVPLPRRRRGESDRPRAPHQDHVDLLLALLKVDYLNPVRTGPRSPSAWLAAELMRTTGARIGEVCAATWDDIDWEVGTITFNDTIVFEEGQDQMRGHLKNADPYRISYRPLPTLHFLRQHRQHSG